ncbi:hypothetical protein M231_08123, partial [Tremella mesenterica]
MSDSSDTEVKVKTVKLRGSENYAQWEAHIATTLMGKGLLPYIDLEPPSKDLKDRENIKDRLKSAKAYSIIFQSLSETISSALPSDVKDWKSPNPKSLWEEIKKQYSAAVGARQAALFQEMARKTILEGEDPMPALAAQRSAHAQLNSAGENLSDKMLAYAMTLALPESFTTLKQTLWLRESLSSSEVQAGVQAEWSRRKTEGESATGMFAKSKFRSKLTSNTFNNPKKQFDRFPPADHSKYCSFHRKT